MEIKGSLENALTEIDALRAKMSELTKRKDIHQIELDLLLQKLRELYDFLSSLQSVDTIAIIAKPEHDKSVKSLKKTDKLKPIGFLREEPEVILDEPKPVKGETKHVKPHEEEILEQKPGKVEESRKSVPDLLAEATQKKHTHIGASLHTKPLQNIEDAIGLNDKFLFIRELFVSNAGRYKETIDVLNNSADFNAAYRYIENNFQWDPDNEATQKLLDLVRRRFISHKNG